MQAYSFYCLNKDMAVTWALTLLFSLWNHDSSFSECGNVLFFWGVVWKTIQSTNAPTDQLDPNISKYLKLYSTLHLNSLYKQNLLIYLICNLKLHLSIHKQLFVTPLVTTMTVSCIHLVKMTSIHPYFLNAALNAAYRK